MSELDQPITPLLPLSLSTKNNTPDNVTEFSKTYVVRNEGEKRSCVACKGWG